MGDLLDEHLGATLLFFGAGGHDNNSGILNLRAFGVEHESAAAALSFSILCEAVELEAVPSPTISMDFSFFLGITTGAI